MNAKSPRNRKGVQAWLVTWEYCGDLIKPPETVAAVLNQRLSGRRVLMIVELLYANASCSPRERIAVAKHHPRSKYFRAEFESPSEDRICCGRNPFLEARRVYNLRAEVNAAGQERFAWDERPNTP